MWKCGETYYIRSLSQIVQSAILNDSYCYLTLTLGDMNPKFSLKAATQAVISDKGNLPLRRYQLRLELNATSVALKLGSISTFVKLELER